MSRRKHDKIYTPKGKVRLCKPLRQDEKTDEIDIHGLFITIAKKCVPVSSLPPAEYEAKIQAEMKRVEETLLQIQKKAKSEVKIKDRESSFNPTNYINKRLKELGIRLDDVKMCNCCLCGRLLLAESFEWLRTFIPRSLPIKVQRRESGRPMCERCSL